MEMVNTRHDAGGYDRSCYQRAIYDGNSLYDAFRKAEKNSEWKPQVQSFEMSYLLRLSEIKQQLIDKTYEFKPSNNFIAKERGKTRYIRGEQIEDRIVKHALCDDVLNPSIQKYLIYDNGASLKGKGIDFTRKRLLTHLNRYYRKFGNDGYILLIDFSKYYDNLLHRVIYEMFDKYVTDDTALWLVRKAIRQSRVDVSYMTDEEYSVCLDTVFNSLEHENIDKNLLTGKRFMEKHLYIGDQVAQTVGIAYPIELDNYIKIVKSEKYYGRYMDDSYIIHHDKEHLKELLKEIIDISKSIGITINENKTHIAKLSELWRFLQTHYALTESGRIIQKINPKRLTVMRRKMKKLAPSMTVKNYSDWFNSWFLNYRKIMSNKQIENMKQLFNKEVLKCIQ